MADYDPPCPCDCSCASMGDCLDLDAARWPDSAHPEIVEDSADA